MSDTTQTETAPTEGKPSGLTMEKLKAVKAMMDSDRRLGVTIAVPLRGFDPQKPMEALTTQCPHIGRTLRELHARRDEHPYSFNFMACGGGLCSAQNRMVHEFLKTDDQWLLRWDADLHDQANKEADAILRLLSWRAQAVIGGIYCKRDRHRLRWCANWLSTACKQGDLTQVAELGGGFKLYHRKILTEVRRIFGDDMAAKKAPSILYRDRETGEMIAAFHQIAVVEGDLLSEDFFLDYLARCAGVPIFADTAIKLRQVEADGTAYPAVGQAWPPLPCDALQVGQIDLSQIDLRSSGVTPYDPNPLGGAKPEEWTP